APDVHRAGLEPAARLLGIEAREVVGHLERPEAHVADVAGFERVLGMTFLALKRLCRHWVDPLCEIGLRSVFVTRRPSGASCHISRITRIRRNWHLPFRW